MEQQLIEIAIKKKLTQVLSKSMLEEVADKVGQKCVDLMRDRTNQKLDIYGRRFGGYNRSYNKAYALSHSGAKTEWAGTTSTPWRLTGQLFSAMAYKVMKIDLSKLSFQLKIYINDINQQGKVMGLQSSTGIARNGRAYSKKAWDFLGLSVAGSYMQTERNEINRIISSEVKSQLAGIKVK